uniref:hypothetical protein n=1 Tax=Microvirga sp. Mcv34 TaxID=2926016 RepID=UPI0021C739A0
RTLESNGSLIKRHCSGPTIYEVVHERAPIGVIYKLEVRTAETEEPRQEAKVSLLSRFLSGRNA